MSFKAGICAFRQGFEPKGWDLSLEAGILAWRLRFEPQGWDLSFEAGILALKLGFGRCPTTKFLAKLQILCLESMSKTCLINGCALAVLYYFFLRPTGRGSEWEANETKIANTQQKQSNTTECEVDLSMTTS